MRQAIQSNPFNFHPRIVNLLQASISVSCCARRQSVRFLGWVSGFFWLLSKSKSSFVGRSSTLSLFYCFVLATNCALRRDQPSSKTDGWNRLGLAFRLFVSPISRILVDSQRSKPRAPYVRKMSEIWILVACGFSQPFESVNIIVGQFICFNTSRHASRFSSACSTIGSIQLTTCNSLARIQT